MMLVFKKGWWQVIVVKIKKGLFVERKQRSGKNSSKKKYIILEWL